MHLTELFEFNVLEHLETTTQDTAPDCHNSGSVVQAPVSEQESILVRGPLMYWKAQVFTKKARPDHATTDDIIALWK